MSASHFLTRIKRFRKILPISFEEAYITFSPIDTIYFLGFACSNICLIFTKKKLILITDKRYEESAKTLKELCNIKIIQNNLFNDVGKLIRNENIEKVIVESEKLSYHHFEELVKIVGTGNIHIRKKFTDEFSSSHDEIGIRNIKKAIQIAEKSLVELLSNIKADITEIDLLAELRFLLNRNGSIDESFVPIVLFGERSSLPHGKSSHRKIKNNTSILLDLGAVVNGYSSDISRTIFFGKPSQIFLQAYELVRTAQEIAIEHISNGCTPQFAHSKVVDYFTRFGKQDNFMHALGHGLGVDLHGYPKISSISEDEFIENQIIALEPALYFPRKFGIRIEDDFLISKKGLKRLTTLPRELIIL